MGQVGRVAPTCPVRQIRRAVFEEPSGESALGGGGGDGLCLGYKTE